MSIQLFVEGGGNTRTSRAACRTGFRKFLDNAGLARDMPQIVPSGSRGNAYNDFRMACAAGESAMLLVDAESPVTAQSPWQHLNQSDGWNAPPGAAADQCHLMVQAMESWFLADVPALQSFYGQGFRPQDLPANPTIENVSKPDVLNGLARAARATKKGSYKKGNDSFEILGRLDLARVRAASPYADRFINAL